MHKEDPMQTPDPAMPSSTPLAPANAGQAPLPIVVAFYRRLRNLPLGAWADVALGAAPIGDDRRPAAGDPSSAAQARARLREIMNVRPRVVARHRRTVQQTVAVAEGFVHRAVAARMKKVALTASLALAARPWLTEETFARLYAPFADLIPLDELTADPSAAPRARRPVELDGGAAGAMC